MQLIVLLLLLLSASSVSDSRKGYSAKVRLERGINWRSAGRNQ